MVKISSIFLLFFIFSFIGKSQEHQFNFKTGYNKIGIYYNPAIGLDFKHHQIHFGIKTYGYNLFFERRPVGPFLAYQYHFFTKNKKVYFYPTLSFSAYRETKTISNLLLSELNFKYGIGLYLNKNISLINETGIGYIMSNSNLFNEIKTIKSAYPSFEISIGLVFHFNIAASK